MRWAIVALLVLANLGVWRMARPAAVATPTPIPAVHDAGLDTPFGAFFRIVADMHANPGTALTVAQAREALRVVRWMAEDNVEGGDFSVAVDAALDAKQMDFVLRRLAQGGWPDLTRGRQELLGRLAARAGWTVETVPAPDGGPGRREARVKSAEHTYNGLALLEQDAALRLTPAQSRAVAPFLKKYLNAKLRVQQAKQSIMGSLDAAQLAYVRGRMRQAFAAGMPPPLRVADFMAFLEPLSASAPSPAATADPPSPAR